MGDAARDNPLVRWVVYRLAWWIVKRGVREQRRKVIALGVIGAVLAGGLALSWRSRSE